MIEQRPQSYEVQIGQGKPLIVSLATRTAFDRMIRTSNGFLEYQIPQAAFNEEGTAQALRGLPANLDAPDGSPNAAELEVIKTSKLKGEDTENALVVVLQRTPRKIDKYVTTPFSHQVDQQMLPFKIAGHKIVSVIIQNPR